MAACIDQPFVTHKISGGVFERPFAELAPRNSQLAPVSIDLRTTTLNEAQALLTLAATSTGIATVKGLEALPGVNATFPTNDVASIFSLLYNNPTIANRLNETYPKRGVFKTAGLTKDDQLIDEKVTIDLSAMRLQRMHNFDPSLQNELGPSFKEVVTFYRNVETSLVPLIIDACSDIAGVDFSSVHKEGNNNYRLIDYYVRQRDPETQRPRCGEHTDYGTVSLIFQDQTSIFPNGGLEYLASDNQWVPVDGSAELVILWGWCAHILSGGMINAVKHRVLRTTNPSERRITGVMFVAPDLEVPLRPMNGKHDGFSEVIRSGEITIGNFKEVMGMRWRKREGNEERGEEEVGSQDHEIERLIRGE